MDKCFECDSTLNINNHHVVPRVLGGKRTIPLCEICHGKVHDTTFNTMKRITLAKIGRQKAIENGVIMGRPEKSNESKETFMNKSQAKEIKELLEKGFSVRKIAKTVNCSTRTVMKVKHIDKEKLDDFWTT
jgi:hypothetical protein